MNSRFSIAAHILTLLASTPGERITSEWIAGSVGTHAVVIRRQLALLRRAGLVGSKGSAGGGWLLLRAPEAVTLAEVRRALGEEASFRMHQEPNPECSVGKGVKGALEDVYADAEAAVDRSLEGWTVADLLKQTLARGKTSESKAQV
jgi:DNA-binding IscR family transcriptional regulator